MRIENKVFVVTGAGNGMGREVTLELLRRGGRVAAVDLSEEALAQTVALATDPSRLSIHRLNVTDVAAAEALPGEVTAAHGTVDGLVNIAGIIHRFVPSAELTTEEMHRVMDIDFW